MCLKKDLPTPLIKFEMLRGLSTTILKECIVAKGWFKRMSTRNKFPDKNRDKI